MDIVSRKGNVVEVGRFSKVLEMGSFSLFLVLFSFLLGFENGEGYMVGNNPYNRVEILDPQGRYDLEWEVDWRLKRITFNVTVQTRGYIGFGLSSNGEMNGADVVIGGVDSNNGQAYFSDRHAIGNQLLNLDRKQDWNLHSARETSTHTYLRFSRAFDTCDSEDYPITNNKVSVIWFYGTRDSEIGFNYENQGFYNVYLLDPDYTPRIIRNPPLTGEATVPGTDLKVWSVSRQLRIPSNQTSYLCSMEKAPMLERKHHAVGFNVVFGSEESRRIAHHLIIYKCTSPPGTSGQTLFEPFVQSKEIQTCYVMQLPTGTMPTQFCSHFYNGHAVGGRAAFTPPHVGIPFGESPDEYYVLQVHYDNPTQSPDIVVDLRMELFYSSMLRPNEAGILAVGHETPGITPSLLIPPMTPQHRIFGHCSRECTERMLPPDGISVFANLLHAHNAGRRLRLQHFRNGRELPWLGSDDNYSFSYQQMRSMREERRILPGDQVTMSCTYDSTLHNGSVIGGFATQQEMCLGFVFAYNRLPDYSLCGSAIYSEEYRRRILGIGNVTWVEDELEYVVDAPDPLQGMRVKDVSDKNVNWDQERRELLQRFHFLHPHVAFCPKEAHARMNDGLDDFTGEVGYPFTASVYRSERECSWRGRMGRWHKWFK